MNPMSEVGPDADRPPVGRLRRWLGGRTLRGQLIAGLVSHTRFTIALPRLRD